ncbi:MAG: precorrin-2 C(20)-methyltransferase [Oligoflexia bacterium]|nr:precorrin-2 C(20)-methyltransferase [Oligoflexia bacterium]
MMKEVKLYGVGVGPGDPALLTFKAVQVIKSVDVLAYPIKAEGAISFALEVCKEHLGSGGGGQSQEKLPLLFPMEKKSATLIPSWKKAVDEVVTRLAEGKSVAFITEGDPSIYSTWAYLYEGVMESLKETEVEFVPGITTAVAVAAATKEILLDGEERLAILPATYGIEILPKLILDFDTIILMKAGKEIKQIAAFLREHSLIDKATLVSNATTAREVIVRDIGIFLDDDSTEAPYFSTLILSIHQRKGALKRC